MTDRLRADPPLGGTLSYIESLIPSLVPSEQRVAREVVDSSADVSLMSASDLAARTGTSAATVIRACQSLGFKGFQHLRLLLLRDLPTSRANAAPTGEGAAQAWMPELFRSAGDALATALGPLDFEEFDRAAAAIAGARRLLIVGNGGSAPVAQTCSLGFLSAGRANEAPADAVLQQLSARSLRSGDVCICISGSGTNSVTLRAAEAASQTEAVVIGLAGFQRSRLEEFCDITLVCSSTSGAWASGLITANLAHLLLVAGLQIAATAVAGRPLSDPEVMDEVMTVLDAEVDRKPESRD